MIAAYPLDHQLDPYAAVAHTTDQFGVQEILRLITRHRGLLLTVVAVTSLATLIWQLTVPTLYRSTATVKVELIDNVGTNQADVQARNSQRIANEVKLYRSRATAERVARDLDVWNRPNVDQELGLKLQGTKDQKIAQARATLGRMLSVEAEEGSDLIEVSVTARSPEFAALAANQFPVAVQALKEAKNLERRQQLLVTLSRDRDVLATQATEASRKLADFRLKNQMLVGSETAETLQQINRVAAEAASAAALRAASAAESAGVARAAGMRSTAGATSPVLQSLERQEAEVAADYARLSQTYGPGHSDIIRLSGQLAEIRESKNREQARALAVASAVTGAESARMAQLARSEAAGTAARAGVLGGTVAALTGKANRNLMNSVELDVLQRQANQATKAYNDVADRIDLVRSEMRVGGVSSTNISPAVANDNPVAPSPFKMTALALVGSGILGMLLVFGREMLDDKLRTVAQMRRLFGLSTFGMLPLIREGISAKLNESPVISQPQSLFAEVARSTAVEVGALRRGDEPQSVLITSPLPGDGKSVVALTLAAAAMTMGRRVAILDLDLRKASILQMVQRDLDAPDLLDVLKGHIDIKKLAAPAGVEPAMPAIWEGDSQIDASRFLLLSASKPVQEPAALLNSGRMQRLIEELKTQFDLIVVNAPATLAVRDARAMCEFTDDTIVVARWGRTTIDQMRATLELLGPDNVAGAVFDQVDYAEHAKRRYGDSIEFYCESSDYYTGYIPGQDGLVPRIRRWFSRPAMAA